MITKLMAAKMHAALAIPMGLNKKGALGAPQGQSKAAWAELLASAHMDGGNTLCRVHNVSKRLRELGAEQFGSDVFKYPVGRIAARFDLSEDEAETAIRLAGAVRPHANWLSGTSGPPEGVLEVKQ